MTEVSTNHDLSDLRVGLEKRLLKHLEAVSQHLHVFKSSEVEQQAQAGHIVIVR